MKIKEAKIDESDKITEFLRSIFQEESLKIYCSNLREKLADGIYKSFIAHKEEEIIGHFGIAILGKGALFNMMAVRPKFRGEGLSRKLLQTAIDYSYDRGDINHVAGYCVLQHPRSERIHDDTFNPVGLMATQNSPLIDSDPLKDSQIFNGNLAVCKTLNKSSRPLKLKYTGHFKRNIKQILNSIDVNVEFDDEFLTIDRSIKREDYIEVNLEGNLSTLNSLGEDYICLGMLPNPFTGFYSFGFVRKNKFNPQGRIEVTFKERKKFIEKILENVN